MIKKRMSLKFIAISLFAVFTFFVSGLISAALPTEGECSGNAPAASGGATCSATIAWIVDKNPVEQRTKAGGTDCGFHCESVKASCWIYFDGSYYHFLSCGG